MSSFDSSFSLAMSSLSCWLNQTPIGAVARSYSAADFGLQVCPQLSLNQQVDKGPVL